MQSVASPTCDAYTHAGQLWIQISSKIVVSESLKLILPGSLITGKLTEGTSEVLEEGIGPCPHTASEMPDEPSFVPQGWEARPISGGDCDLINGFRCGVPPLETALLTRRSDQVKCC
ncbi:hypothetical protein TNCT_654631 [Trichonephila clavata]|uniref:Uncharacterized protein n=1 Tax=Trichonephila clavata TaxID=2740835 RepID=A0A8X6HA67_TRICU|nr:hypothetical protein TNCT_654631 [Trichonephila clavata]